VDVTGRVTEELREWLAVVPVRAEVAGVEEPATTGLNEERERVERAVLDPGTA
jgi:hypothetical protein